jgi:hypothetical protein
MPTFLERRKIPTRLMASEWPLAMRLWRNGMDTFAIAERLKVEESRVYNTLYSMREARRRSEGDLFDAAIARERENRGETKQEGLEQAQEDNG